ncbi:glycoside hydrolase family 5 protein [Fulvivirga ligni]|uniref:glycoside hydrolase family 5 protein n=1 Tax=Fulvivirga ligni TaxID=2904246 RepID=UPI001F23ACDA|nr:cellulase family glycosylhydrolase [Fulvivirga ligni]UII19440.1 glycoside hydrolase family 5 protein [Fulvivirga ligni]
MILYRYIFLSLFVICLVQCDLVAQDNSGLGQIRVDGKHFVDESGEVIVFRGLDTSDPDKLASEGHWNRRYFEEMADWGANMVRFPVHPGAWRHRGEQEYLKLLDQGVQWAGEQGMYVMIDWHSIGNLKEEKFHGKGYVTTFKETKQFWDTISKHFKGNNTVAMLELFNEPTTRNGEYGSITWQEWKPMMEEIIKLIRDNGNDAIPLVAGFNWAYDLTVVKDNPIEAEGIAYVSHPYPQKREKPWFTAWTEDWGFVAEKYPVILTEVGFCGPNDRGAHIPVISDESYGEALDEYCDKHGISYMVWVFDAQWSPMLISDWDFTPTTQGKYFKKSLQSRK